MTRNQLNSVPEGHITLKEASHISGYAPDYIGQLIRKGKLYGRQVYFNIAWVTTEEAIREYVARDSRTDLSSEKEKSGFEDVLRRLENQFLSEVRLMKALQVVLYASLGFLIVFSLFLFHIFSVRLDARLNEKAKQSLEAAVIAPKE